MTFYQAQLLKIRDNALPKKYLLDRVIKAKHVIDDRFSDGIDLDLISGEAFLSKFHLIRLFKTCYGMTPYQLITEKRIQKAQTLLSRGASVAETCFQLGFNSPASFSIYFRKHLGYTPTHYKKAISNTSV